MFMNYSDATSPTLLLNTEICRRNIARMAAKCRRLGIGLNPHFKTHQSAEIARYFQEEGVQRITVSSLAMAEYFADAGWDNITLAFPVNLRELPRIDALAGRIQLSLFVLSEEVAQALGRQLKHAVVVVLEIDAGYARTGLPAGDTGRISGLLSTIEAMPRLQLYGFYIHAGHTYEVHGREAVAAIHGQSMAALHALKKQFGPLYPGLQLSLGDTPSCSLLEDFKGVSEIRPGNFVFYDVMQADIGACRYADIAVALAAPVVAKEPERNEVVVHGGAIHLSKDSLETGGRRLYGRIVEISSLSWSAPLPLPENYVQKLSQEHGIVRLSDEAFARVEIGGLLGILPVHSCLSADCMGGYLTENGSYITMLDWRRRG